MRATCWYGKKDIRSEMVPDPEIVNPRDAIVRVTLTAICGSDLHLYNGYNPAMKKGDVLGHEFMGEVVELGSEVKNLAIGDRVLVPFNIACGRCFFCKQELWSLCENSNPKASLEEKEMKYPTSGLFGYSDLYGGYAGGQSDYVRVPYADVGPLKVSNDLPDEKLLFLTDIFPTGYMAAENCQIKRGDTIAVWGCGPVGQFAIQSAFLLGAEKVIAIDRFVDRLNVAKRNSRAEVINYEEVDDLTETLKEMTGGRGPDSCIDAVGMESHMGGIGGMVDKAKQTMRLETDRPHALRQAIMACRPGGTVSIPGVYTGFIDAMPMGVAFGKGLTFKMGQTHTHKYMRKLLPLVENGAIDPSFIITDVLELKDAPDGYRTFNDKIENCLKIVLKP